MTHPTLHAGEFQITDQLVVHLLSAQFPHWADLPLQRLTSSGTDNAIYRLGDTMLVRLPRTAAAAGRVSKEHDWLPLLAPQLPLAIPTPIAKGVAAVGYPASWSIYPWFDGHVASHEQIAAMPQAIGQLAQFIHALQRIPVTNGPAPGEHNFFRGEPLANRDAETRTAIEALRGTIDGAAALAAWSHALSAAPYQSAPVWIHGDLLPANLLLAQGRLAAVIDFGGLGVGDPACDLLTAWSLFNRHERAVFRQQLAVDEASWARGRGWALNVGVTALPYYRLSNPVFAKVAARMINEVLADHAG